MGLSAQTVKFAAKMLYQRPDMTICRLPTAVRGSPHWLSFAPPWCTLFRLMLQWHISLRGMGAGLPWRQKLLLVRQNSACRGERKGLQWGAHTYRFRSEGDSDRGGGGHAAG